MARTLEPFQTQFGDYDKYYDQMQHEVGNLLAGRQEFPWVVDIRAEDMDQEFWAIGNILSYRHVLTSCRFLLFHLRFLAAEQYAVKYFNDGLVTFRPGVRASTSSESLNATPTQIEVHFGTTYLWDHTRPQYVPDGMLKKILTREYFESGVRLAKDLILHPECEVLQLKKAVGIIELANSFPTRITPKAYMPVLDYSKVNAMDMTKDAIQSPSYSSSSSSLSKQVCYVASFGRNYYNAKNHKALDFKVKYRVYITEASDCFSTHWYRYQCEKIDGLCAISDKRVSSSRKDYTACFSSRAKVGAVCDHDNGAPVVCDGKVYGIVMMGASFQYCHDMIPIPFVVLTTYPFSLYFKAYMSSSETYDRVAYEYYQNKLYLLQSGQPVSATPSAKLAVLIILIALTA